ncbi:hypothetical protein BGZ65_006878 [Modicella reniformis]|uniref:Uncharacterized protein n=1 Tax=Modicella reniformis TaxID=1440133 RepID=A0A9P6MLI1_9FUNG|nr:hypothetical protein BGZ65_006878 [Modicella reniformis]
MSRRLVADPKGKEHLMSVFARKRDDKAWKLAHAETRFIDRYYQSPVALKEMVKKGNSGAMAEALKDGEAGLSDEDLCDLFNEPEATIYEPGEYHPKASNHRKNRKRKSSSEQQVGRKTDGIILPRTGSRSDSQRSAPCSCHSLFCCWWMGSWFVLSWLHNVFYRLHVDLVLLEAENCLREGLQQDGRLWVDDLLVLYVDEGQAVEKEHAAKIQEENQQTAARKAWISSRSVLTTISGSGSAIYRRQDLFGFHVPSPGSQFQQLILTSSITRSHRFHHNSLSPVPSLVVASSIASLVGYILLVSSITSRVCFFFVKSFRHYQNHASNQKRVLLMAVLCSCGELHASTGEKRKTLSIVEFLGLVVLISIKDALCIEQNALSHATVISRLPAGPIELSQKRKLDEDEICPNCSPVPAQGIEHLLSYSPYIVRLATRSYVELSDEICKLLIRDSWVHSCQQQERRFPSTVGTVTANTFLYGILIEEDEVGQHPPSFLLAEIATSGDEETCEGHLKTIEKGGIQWPGAASRWSYHYRIIMAQGNRDNNIKIGLSRCDVFPTNETTSILIKKERQDPQALSDNVLGLAQVGSHFEHPTTYTTCRASLGGYSAVSKPPVTLFTLTTWKVGLASVFLSFVAEVKGVKQMVLFSTLKIWIGRHEDNAKINRLLQSLREQFEQRDRLEISASEKAKECLSEIATDFVGQEQNRDE